MVNNEDNRVGGAKDTNQASPTRYSVARLHRFMEFEGPCRGVGG